ncbi:MAG TPA: permease [Elainellaceae cyanobacterium]
MSQVNGALTLFFSLLVEAMPFLLIGVLFSSLILLFVDERKLVSALPRNPFLGALAGSLVGFLFPVCECGNVPVARRLLVQGAPASVAIGFMLAAPTINPIVFWATWTAFRGQPEIVFLRIILSLFIATTIGWIFSTQADLRPLLQPSVARMMSQPEPPLRSDRQQSDESRSLLLQSGTFLLGREGKPQRLDGNGAAIAAMATLPQSRSFPERLQMMIDNAIQELRELGGMLVIGSAIAAIVQIAIPREVVLSLGQGPTTSILAMMALACIVSICSTVDSFFALSFASTFTTGALLAFLVFGPMIDLKNIGLLFSVFRGRAILYLFAIAGQMTFLLALLVNLYLS